MRPINCGLSPPNAYNVAKSPAIAYNVAAIFARSRSSGAVFSGAGAANSVGRAVRRGPVEVVSHLLDPRGVAPGRHPRHDDFPEAHRGKEEHHYA